MLPSLSKIPAGVACELLDVDELHLSLLVEVVVRDGIALNRAGGPVAGQELLFIAAFVLGNVFFILFLDALSRLIEAELEQLWDLFNAVHRASIEAPAPVRMILISI